MPGFVPFMLAATAVMLPVLVVVSWCFFSGILPGLTVSGAPVVSPEERAAATDGRL